MDIKLVTDLTVSTVDMEVTGDLEEFSTVGCTANGKGQCGFWYGMGAILSLGMV